jgi:hypothetical protein
MAKFWHSEMEVIKEWIDLLVDENENEEYSYSDMIENWILGWTTAQAKETYGSREWQRLLILDDASADMGEQSMKIASGKRAWVKCPSCSAQDYYEEKMMDFFMREHNVNHPIYDKVMLLVSKAQERFWQEDG